MTGLTAWRLVMWWSLLRPLVFDWPRLIGEPLALKQQAEQPRKVMLPILMDNHVEMP